MKELDPREQAALEMEIREHVADKEKHERAIGEIVEKMRAEGYFREGETTQFVPVDPTKLRFWKKKDGSWPEGHGKAVGYLNATSLRGEPDPEWIKKFPSIDHLHPELLAAGYKVEILPDFDLTDDVVHAISYKIYESA